MALSEKRKGEWFIYSGILFGALFPIITVLSYAALPSLISLGWSTAFAAIFFGLIVSYKGTWHELRNPLLWKYGLYITLFISILFYGLFFIGLTKTLPGNAAIIALLEVFTSFLFFNVFREERISFEYKVGALLMIGGAVIVLVRGFSGVGIGDLLIVAATMCAPVGNFFQQKARDIASSETILFLRSILAVPVIFLLAFAFGQHASYGNVADSLFLLVVNGVLIFGLSKILWVEAIHRISVTKAQALSSITPLATLLLAWLLLRQAPNVWQLTAVLPLILGTLLLTDHLHLRKSK
ncbi:MAG: DMT family transporter [Patescibacteria group bacterium]